jgi:CHASE3 domain sensor protein
MAKSDGTGRNPSLSATIRTRSYVLMRLEELADTVQAHGRERAELTKQIQGTPSDSGPELKKLRERRIYLAKRIAILREEQKTLQSQRKEVNQTVAQLSRGKSGGG